MGRIRAAWDALVRGSVPQPRVGRIAGALMDEDVGWTKIGGSRRDHSLPRVMHEKMLTDSLRSWQRDGIARRWVRMKTSFVIGNAPRAVSEHEDDTIRDAVQAVLDEFQDDPGNALPMRMLLYVRSLYATGGLCLLVAGAETPGSTVTRVGRVDPEDIDEAISDPDNADVRIAILRKSYGPERAERVVHPVIGPDGQVAPQFRAVALGASIQIRTGRGPAVSTVTATVGLPCMYLGINDLSGQHLGISDLYPALDAMTDYSDATSGGVQRAIAALSFAHLRRVPQGTPQDQLDKIAQGVAESVSRGFGNVLVLTDDQTHEVVNPTLASADVKGIADVPFKTICITSGFPPHWFAEPGDTNLATAGETAGPVVSMLAEDQSIIGGFFRSLFLYALRRKPEMQRLERADPDALKFSLSLPVLKGKDEVRAATVFTQDLAALSELRASGVLTTEAYQREAARLANEYGFEIGPDDIPDPDDIDAERDAMRSAFQSQDPDAPVDGDPDETGVDEDGAEGNERRAA